VNAPLRTRVARAPLIGGALRTLYYAGRQQLKYARGAAIQATRELRKRRERSARSVTRRNDRKGYEQLYSSPDLLADYLQPSRLRFYDEVADVCTQFAPRSIVDVGCGTGHLVAAILKRVGPSTEAVGIDYAGSAIDRARELFPSTDWLVGDVYALPRDLDGRFDLVLCTEVLEHLERPVEALEALGRLRAPDGRLVLTVPDGTLDDFEGHLNFWSEAEFRLTLERLGDVSIRRIDDDRTLLAVVEANGRGR
jgi:SAM-dependent methyltransferase